MSTKISDQKKTNNEPYALPGGVNYNKAFAVGQYVNGLGLGVAEMMQRGDHIEYAWNNGDKNNPNRIEMLEAIHKKAMEAINSL